MRTRAGTPRTPCVAAALLLILGAAGCGQERTPSWRVSQEPSLEIGRVSGEDAYLFQAIRDARFLPDGRIVVADMGQGAVRVYGPDGEFLRAIGGRGEGPGEFRRVDGMWLTSGGRVGVWDGALQRLSTFTSEGEHESVAPVLAERQDVPGNLETFLGAFTDDVLLASLTGMRPGAAGVVPDRWILLRFDVGGSLEARLGRIRGMRRAGGQPLPFTPLPHVAVHGDSIFVSDGYGAELSVLDGRGERVGTIDFPPVDTAGEDAWAAFEAELTRRGEGGLVERLAELPDKDRLPQVAGLLVDEGGLLWVKSYDPGSDALYLKEGHALRPTTGGTWRVIRRDGTVVARVPMPDGVAPLQIREDRILGLSRDELGVERIVVYGLNK